MKRILLFALILSLLISTIFTGVVLAEPKFDDSKLKSKSLMLIDASSGRKLFEKGGDERIFPASTTKILTLIVALEKGDLNAEFTAGEEIRRRIGANSSKMGLIEGEKVKLEDLLYGMMLPSGNDAANTIAVGIAGSVEAFAEMMNEKAQEIGMENSRFTEPSGLQDEAHYTTPADMATLTQYALQNPMFKKIFGTTKYTVPPTNKHKDPQEFENSNLLMKPDDANYYKYATGGKTGSTPAAGGCLVAVAEKDGSSFIAVVYGDMTEKRTERWQAATQMFEYGFNNFKTIDVSKIISQSEKQMVDVLQASVKDPQGGRLELTPGVGSDGKSYFSGTPEQVEAIESGTDLDVKVTIDENIQAPISKGQVLGKIEYSLGDEVLITANLLASRDVAQTNPEELTEQPPVRTQEAASPDEVLGGNNISPWWWLLLPAVLIVLLLWRMAYVKRQKRKRFKKRKKYSYSIRR